MPAVSAFRIVVLASGAGTNLQAILDRCTGEAGSRWWAWGPTGPPARALERARAAGVETAVFAARRRTATARRPRRGDGRLARGAGADLIVIAGYMQLLRRRSWRGSATGIVNVHPALLPSFPGLDAIGQALEPASR